MEDRGIIKHSNLQKGIEIFLKSEQRIQGALVGINVLSAVDGSTIYEHMGNIRLHPASNMKIFTTAAALSVLGENYRLHTEIYIDGFIHNGQLNGNLYIKGKGDPTLLPEDLVSLVEKIKEAGITKINGNIIGDDTWYDQVRLSPDMVWSDEHFYYGSQVSALTVSPDTDYDTGTIIVKVKPTQIGEKPALEIFPKTDYIYVENRAMTHLSGDEEDLIIRREHGGNKIIVEGTIPVSFKDITEWIAVWEPTEYVIRLFQDILEDFGIRCQGKIQTGETPIDAQLLYRHSSMPLSEIIIPFMKLSNNGHGEMLTKELGKVVYGEGSWEKGLEVLEAELIKFGVNTDTLIIRDGSGISHATLIPVNEMSRLLYEIQNEPWFSTFLQSLPIAGETERMVGGTLRERLESLNVKAKTGTIYGVSTLSGYLKAKSGKKVIFSLILNNLLDEDEGPVVIDRLVEILAEQI